MTEKKREEDGSITEKEGKWQAKPLNAQPSKPRNLALSIGTNMSDAASNSSLAQEVGFERFVKTKKPFFGEFFQGRPFRTGEEIWYEPRLLPFLMADHHRYQYRSMSYIGSFSGCFRATLGLKESNEVVGSEIGAAGAAVTLEAAMRRDPERCHQAFVKARLGDSGDGRLGAESTPAFATQLSGMVEPTRQMTKFRRKVTGTLVRRVPNAKAIISYLFGDNLDDHMPGSPKAGRPDSPAATVKMEKFRHGPSALEKEEAGDSGKKWWYGTSFSGKLPQNFLPNRLRELLGSIGTYFVFGYDVVVHNLVLFIPLYVMMAFTLAVCTVGTSGVLEGAGPIWSQAGMIGQMCEEHMERVLTFGWGAYRVLAGGGVCMAGRLPVGKK